MIAVNKELSLSPPSPLSNSGCPENVKRSRGRAQRVRPAHLGELSNGARHSRPQPEQRVWSVMWYTWGQWRQNIQLWGFWTSCHRVVSFLKSCSVLSANGELREKVFLKVFSWQNISITNSSESENVLSSYTRLITTLTGKKLTLHCVFVLIYMLL